MTLGDDGAWDLWVVEFKVEWMHVLVGSGGAGWGPLKAFLSPANRACSLEISVPPPGSWTYSTSEVAHKCRANTWARGARACTPAVASSDGPTARSTRATSWTASRTARARSFGPRDLRLGGRSRLRCLRIRVLEVLLGWNIGQQVDIKVDFWVPAVVYMEEMRFTTGIGARGTCTARAHTLAASDRLKTTVPRTVSMAL